MVWRVNIRELFRRLVDSAHVRPSTHTARTDPLEAAPRRWFGLRALAALLLIGAVIIAGRSASDVITAFAAWVDRSGVWAPLAFIAGYAIACVAFLPASILTLAAGAIFGLARGILFVLAGATLGATLSFLVARHAARGAVERRLSRNPRLAAIDGIVGADGRRIVLLMRLSPLFPFSALNYALGLTRLRLGDFLIAMIGIIPGTALYVYTGTVAGAVVSAAGPNAPARGVAYYAVLVLGLIATLVVTGLATRAARRALRGTKADPNALADD